MNKDVYKYFIDFDKMKLPKNSDNLIEEDSEKIVEEGEELGYSNIKKYMIGKTPMYVKEYPDDPAPELIHSIASSKLYRDINFLTPPVYPIKTWYDRICAMSQDVNTAKGLYIYLPQRNLTFRDTLDKIKNNRNMNNKWQILYDKKAQNRLLKIMTPDCLEELVSMHLLDDLRTDPDRHLQNYFLYKSHYSSKFEGVIPIDLDYSYVLWEDIRNKNDFINFVDDCEISTYTPVNRECSRTHSEHIANIRKLINDDKLSASQIELLRNAVGYDFPKEIKNTQDKYNLHPHKFDVYSPISWLWEYNRKALGKELGM